MSQYWKNKEWQRANSLTASHLRAFMNSDGFDSLTNETLAKLVFETLAKHLLHDDTKSKRDLINLISSIANALDGGDSNFSLILSGRKRGARDSFSKSIELYNRQTEIVVSVWLEFCQYPKQDSAIHFAHEKYKISKNTVRKYLSMVGTETKLRNEYYRQHLKNFPEPTPFEKWVESFARASKKRDV